MKVGCVAVAVVLALLGFAVAEGAGGDPHLQEHAGLVQVYALTSTQLLHETLDLFLTREAAETELREILLDEPDLERRTASLSIELDELDVSAN